MPDLSATASPRSERSTALSPRIRRLKERLHSADYEICLARARHFTAVHRRTEGLDPALRCALALQQTLAEQRVTIYPDEQLAGSKTERYLSTPLSVERGDFLRSLQLELDILERKRTPFFIAPRDAELFWREILPYWDGRTLRDEKVRRWRRAGLLPEPGAEGLTGRLRAARDAWRFVRHVGLASFRKILGANAGGPWSWRRLRNLWSLRHELAFNGPTPAVYCLDVQGHLCLGLDRVIELGLEELGHRAERRLSELRAARGADDDPRAAFLQAVIISLEAAIHYAERFAELAAAQAGQATSAAERRRLERIARHCRWVPRRPARTFAEALQSAWLTQVVAEIQFGTMDVFAAGRIDQYLWPCYRRDIAAGRLRRDEAVELLQELFLKLSANISPTPEIGMESNAVLGNSQHNITVGGLTADGTDATNELSLLVLEAYEQLGGTVNQLCVRLHPRTPPDFLRRAGAVFRKTGGIAFYNDAAVIEGLRADGYAERDARRYCLVGCVETCGHSDTQGCVAGHDFVLPAALMLTLTDGAYPPPAPGQQRGWQSGDPAALRTFEELLAAFERQLAHQLCTMIRAIEGKDRAHAEQLPAPFVSATLAGPIENAADITAGGARYDFTSVDVRGLATTVDSLLAVDRFVFERRELSLPALVTIVLGDFEGHEALRQRLIREPPKYGNGSLEADALARRLVRFIHDRVAWRRNARGGRYRVAYFSLGSHVIDGFFVGPTPDGRRRGMPVSNGVSPSNLLPEPRGPLAALRAAAGFPPPQISSGIALNLRFHESFIKSRRGLGAFTAMLRTYFELGGMQLQPNVISTAVLRDAQRHPERYRDLIVKVSGYSARFTDLGPTIQDDIIARAEFTGSRS